MAVGIVLLAGGCFPLPPIEVTIPLDIPMDLGAFEEAMEFEINAGSGHTFEMPGAVAGTAIPLQPSNQMPLTGFPSEDEILDMVEDATEGVTFTQLDLSEITLRSMRLDATQGDFGTITSVDVFFVPQLVSGVEQDPVLIGSATSNKAFSTSIALTAPAALDFMQLIRDNDNNPGTADPTAYMVVSGLVPEPEAIPVWDTTVTVTADGHLAVETDPFEFCEVPTADDITQLIAEYGGQLAADLATVTKLELLDIVLTANNGDFSDVSSIGLYYVPKPVDGVEQDPISIGEAVAGVPFGSTIVLVPGEPVNFLRLIRDNDNNPSEECPSVYLTFEGNIPESLPSWSTEITLNVHVTVGLF